jgi:hypothetical protein
MKSTGLKAILAKKQKQIFFLLNRYSLYLYPSRFFGFNEWLANKLIPE